jgi:surface antigen
MKTRRVALLMAGLSALVILAARPSLAGNLTFLKQAPVSYFNDEDMRMLKEAVHQVLDDSNVRASKSWSNPETGNYGKVEGRSAFKTAAGVSCKKLRVTNHASGVEGQATYTVCKDPERDWVVDPTAKPAG